MSRPGPLDGTSDANRDARVLAWMTAPEAASSRRVLDATFAELPGIRQQRWRPWTPFVDSLSRPVSMELPRWAWIAVALLALVAVSLATMTVASRVKPVLQRLSALPAAPAVMEEVPCPAEFAAVPTVRCRLATVPERHEASAGPAVRVLVAEFAAPTGAAAAGAMPIVTSITIDPTGERTILDLSRFADATGRTVIGVMPRGTGASEPSLACPELQAVPAPGPSQSISDLRWRATLAAAVRDCRARLTAAGIDVEAYGVAQQAADLESIRKGLGVDRWLVRSIGGESRLAIEVIRDYPDSVAGAVLVRPAFPGEDAVLVATDAVASSVSTLADMCAADAFCAGRYRPPDDAWATVMRGPDAELAGRAIRSILSSTSSVASAPSRLDRIASGDPTWPAAEQAVRGWCMGTELACSAASGWSGGSELSAACLGRGPSSRAKARSPAVADPWDTICDAWVGGRRDASTMDQVTSDVPVVAIAAAIDPFHSIRSVTAGMAGFERGVVATVSRATEDTGTGCLATGGTSWLADPSAALPPSCTAAAAPRFADAP